MGRPVIDLTRKKFCKLLVIQRADDYIHKNGRHETAWLCKCD